MLRWSALLAVAVPVPLRPSLLSLSISQAIPSPGRSIGFPFFCQPHANLGGQHWDRVTCSKVRWGWGEEEILLAPHVPKQTGMAARKTALARDDAAKRRGVQSPALQPLLPFARQFYAIPDTYMWFDVDGHAHEVLQGEGGEQGDPRMPALYAVFAFLDDVYIVALPKHVRAFYDLLVEALWNRTRI
eukprot:s2771_g15.t1